MSKKTGPAVQSPSKMKAQKGAGVSQKVKPPVQARRPKASAAPPQIGAVVGAIVRDEQNTIAPVSKGALARLAVNVWRLERRAAREENAGWAQSLIERLKDDLRDLDIEIIDHLDTTYNDRQTVELVHSDAPDNWDGPLVVTEVVSPTIRYSGAIIEHGKVVVGADPARETE